MGKVSDQTDSGARPGSAGRFIRSAARWAVILWTALNLFSFACLIDIMGLGRAFVGVGLFWLVGAGVIALVATIARLATWVGHDIWSGLRTEIRSLNPVRWISGRRRRSGVWDEWLDHPIAVPSRSRNRSARDDSGAEGEAKATD